MRSPVIHRDVVDGIEVRWIEAPPPFTAYLLFRVGIYDETLPTSGITHLVEHLALNPFHERRHLVNGAVEGRRAAFVAGGSRAEVEEFLTAVCDNVANLAIDRLSTEARVLGAESQARSKSAYTDLLRAFFGAQGPGLSGFPELGLFRVGPADVEAWAARCFTRANAILLLTGQPPPDLRLPLEPGSHRRPPPPIDGSQMLTPHRALLYGRQPAGVCLGALTPRLHEVVVAAQIMAERLQHRLRHDLGLVYQVTTAYEALSRDLGYLFFAAQCEPDRGADVSIAFMEVLTELAANGPTDFEVETARRLPDPAHLEPNAFMRSEALRLVSDELYGDRVIPAEDLPELRRHVDQSSIAATVGRILDGSLVIAQPSYLGELTPWTTPPDDRYHGKTYVRRRGRNLWFDTIVVAEDGVSALHDGEAMSFPHAEMAAYTVVSPSVRELIRLSGDSLRIDADDWRTGERLIAQLDEMVSTELRVVLPSNPE